MSQGVQNYDPVFLDAVRRLIAVEGGYTFNPEDPGGETKFGISKRSYPDVDIKNLTSEQAIEMYWNDWWLKPGLGRLKGDVAAKVFNLSVVMGVSHAVTCLQRALRANLIHPAAITSSGAVAEDGALGLATIACANSVTNVPALLAAIRSEAAGYFRTTDAIAHMTHGGEHPFLKGWLTRAYS